MYATGKLESDLSTLVCILLIEFILSGLCHGNLVIARTTFQLTFRFKCMDEFSGARVCDIVLSTLCSLLSYCLRGYTC